MTTNRLLAIAAALGVVIVMLCLCLVGLTVAFAPAQLGLSNEPELAEPMPTLPPLASPLPNEAAPAELPAGAVSVLRAEEELLEALYATSARGVVNIAVSGVQDSVLGEAGQGSGFVWDKEGHIVTNNHVVAGGETILVNFADNTQAVAEVVGTDPDSDLAVIRVDLPPEQLFPLPIGDSSTLRVGQRAVALGSPFGFEQTLTMGIVSGVGRTVPADIQGFSLPNLIQTDAAINPGNSGGPLLDIEGRVIGVNTLIFSQTRGANSGVGFALPINKVRAVVPDLIATGRYETPYLGLSFLPTPMTPSLAEALGLPGVTRGVLVTGVVPGGPSEAAGLRAGDREVTLPNLAGSVNSGGDVVVSVDDVPVSEFDDLVNYLDTRRVGDVVTLGVIRDGQPLDVPVTLGARPRP